MTARMGSTREHRRVTSAAGRISLSKSSTPCNHMTESEMRYRRWLALSEGTAEQHKSTAHNQDRPHLNDSQDHHFVRHNKASMLRRSQLPTPPAEINYNKVAKQKKDFEKRKRSLSATLVMTSNIPDDDQTPHQFLVGSRYNSAHNIDSRSLSRLGVYVSRGNISRVFVNSAGTIPPSNAIYGRVRSSPAGMQQPEYQLSSAFRLQSAPLLNEDSTAQPEDFSDCDSVVVQVEEQSISPQPVVLQSSRPNSAYSNEPEVQQDTHEQLLSDAEEDSANIPTQHEEEEDSALIMSPEAQQLAVEILHHSLTTLDQNNQPDNKEDKGSTECITAATQSGKETHYDNKILNKEVSCQTTSVDTSSSPDHTDNSQLETQSVAAQGDMEVNEDSTVHKTTSTIFVDLSKLQESPPSD